MADTSASSISRPLELNNLDQWQVFMNYYIYLELFFFLPFSQVFFSSVLEHIQLWVNMVNVTILNMMGREQLTVPGPPHG